MVRSVKLGMPLMLVMYGHCLFAGIVWQSMCPMFVFLLPMLSGCRIFGVSFEVRFAQAKCMRSLAESI